MCFFVTDGNILNGTRLCFVHSFKEIFFVLVVCQYSSLLNQLNNANLTYDQDVNLASQQ